MNKWDVFTWLSIAVLILGSLAIFAWFLHDAVKLFRSVGRPRRRDD